MFKALLCFFSLLLVNSLLALSVQAQYIYKTQYDYGNGSFYQPKGVGLDDKGNLYIADTHNHRIQKYNGASWTTLGSYGTALGQFDTPNCIAFDAQGNLYVADTYNSRIQKYNGSTWSSLGVFGTAPGQFNHVTDLAIDTKGNIFVADAGNHRIQKFNGTTWSILGTAGDGVGHFNTPYGIDVDSLGNLFVADTFNNRIQKFNGSTWVVIGSYGTALGQFNLPRGVTVDGKGNLFVADTFNNRIQKFNGSTWIGIGSLGEANGELQNPTQVALDQQGNVYSTDPGNNRIQVFSLATVSVCSADGFILRERWDNVKGYDVRPIPVNTPPSSISTLTSFEAPANVGSNYGVRVRGYVCPPVSGVYSFWISSDDNGVLYLSSNDQPAAKKRIAWVNGATKPKDWTKYASQQSAPIYLEAGKKYYIEALHKEVLGDDHLEVGWILPGALASNVPTVIPGNSLSPFHPNDSIQSLELKIAASPVEVYPNPISGGGVSTIKFLAEESGQVGVELYDSQGQLVRNIFQGSVASGETKQLELDGSNLKKGIYVLKLVSASKVVQQKIVVQN